MHTQIPQPTNTMPTELTNALTLLKKLTCCYNNMQEDEFEKQTNNDIMKIIEIDNDISVITTCNINTCKQILEKLKLIIINLPSVDTLLPIHKKDINELLLIREILEKGVIISIRDRNIKAFSIYMAQLFMYYFDYKDILPKSKKQNGILGAYLLYLLSSNLIGDFHMTLEMIPIEDHNDAYITYVLTLEQHIMDGYFNYVLTRHEKAPLYLYSLFIEKLHVTIRYKLADCIFASSNSISLKHACELLKLQNENEFHEFIAAYNMEKKSQGETLLTWEIKDGKLLFNTQVEVVQEFPTLEILNNTIGYATELERII